MTHLEEIIYKQTTPEDWIFLAKSFSIEKIAELMGCTIKQVNLKVGSAK